MLGKRTMLSSRVPWNLRNFWICSGWCLGRLQFENNQWVWHPSGSSKYWSLPPFKTETRTKKVVIKLSKRKDVFSILQRKKKLKSVDITNMYLTQGSLVFINQSVCSYYKHLWSLCKSLHSKKMIHSFWVSIDNVSLKVRESIR